MPAARLILLLLLILVAVVLVVLVLRRGSAQRDAQRVEAAGLRTEADTLATTVAGQSAFAEQAAQRAELARVEAEDKAREAARLEEEAAQHQAAVEATQRDYEATMRRADDIDPDVKESAFPPVVDDGTEGGTADGTDGGTEGGTEEPTDEVTDGTGVPMTRAERREAREAEAAGATAEPAAGSSAPSAASSVPAAGAAGAAAAGATAWAAGGDGDAEQRSERIASAADFRDDVPDEPADAREESGAEGGAAEPSDGPAVESGEVYAAADGGTEADMSNDARTDTTEHTAHDDGLETGGAAAAASAGAGGAYAATRALHEERADETTTDDATADDATTEGTDTARTADAATADDATSERTEPSDDLSRDAESPSGEWGGPRQDEPAEMTIVEPEHYAATEPVLASEQTPPVSPETGTTDGDQAHGDATDEDTRHDVTDGEATDHAVTADEATAHEHAPAEAGAAVVETDDTARSEVGRAEESTQERYDPTPTRDWAADEGELLDENHDRGERLEAERADLAHQSDTATASTAAEPTAAEPTASEATASEPTVAEHTASDDAPSDDTTEPAASPGRRVSAFDELRDGGFGVGSAAPLDDGGQPLDHPVAAYRDTMTYRVPGDAGYDSAEPHVWFYDEGAAERSGFRRSEG